MLLALFQHGPTGPPGLPGPQGPPGKGVSKSEILAAVKDMIEGIIHGALLVILIIGMITCSAVRPYSSHSIFLTAGKHRITFVTRFEHICHN